MSAVFRTTVLEGETLVMRKLVVSGIVAAEKTYLTWLTILKEVSQPSPVSRQQPVMAVGAPMTSLELEQTKPVGISCMWHEVITVCIYVRYYLNNV